MKKKCEKYESLFIFGSEDDLKKHLEECPYCRKIHAKMEEVAELVKEVKPLIKRKRQPLPLIRLAASISIVILAFMAINLHSNNIKISNKQDLNYLLMEDISIIEEMGFPTDEYGLLKVE